MKLLNSLKKIVIPFMCAAFLLVSVTPVIAADNGVVLEQEGAVDGYSLVVLEDEAVPLAAAPVSHDYSGSVIWVVCLSIIVVLLGFYAATIVMYNSRVNAIAPLMTKDDIKEVKKFSVMFNPFKHNDVLAAKESDLASR